MSVFETIGACSWIELVTTNKTASIKFYEALLGWDIHGQAMPDGTEYSLIKVGEEGIGGIIEMPEIEPGNGSWGIYITVGNVDETVAKAESLGGKAIMPPFDVPGVGRIGKITDPHGAIISVITYSNHQQ